MKIPQAPSRDRAEALIPSLPLEIIASPLPLLFEAHRSRQTFRHDQNSDNLH
jgi:hypothetical protein